jgi:hypothetical protein
LRTWFLPSITLLLVAAAPQFEGPPTLQASKVVSAKFIKGPHYTLGDQVKGEGYYLQFQVNSEYGNIEADGRTVLKTRIIEVGALAQLSEVSKSEVFAKAAGGAVLNVGKGVASVVNDPEGTAKGIGSGLKRFGGNVGRKAKGAAESVTADDKTPEGPDESADKKALDAAGGAANSVLGVNGSARRWAKKLGVDPYSTNPVLHKALVDIGKIDAAGGIAAKVVVPIPMVVSTTATVGGLVWGADPQEVRKKNEAWLAELGVPKDVAAKYFINGNYTVTSQVRLITSLQSVKAPGSADYVDAASEAKNEREALFFVESAEMLAGLHKTQPVAAILKDSRAVVAKTATGAIVLLPFDWLRWTESLSKAATEIAGRAKQELGATALEARVAGKATDSAKAGLKAIGWTVKEQVIAGLSVPPAI